MTPKERAAMQQALIYLDAIINGEGVKAYQLEGTAFTLREALDNSLKPKCFADYQPNHAIDRACASCAVAVECQTGEQAEQEPVHESLQIAAVALQDIACSSQTNNLLWWQIRAREAQKQIAERLTNAAPVQQAEQEPLMDYERINALREGEQNRAEDAYFFVRPENDTPSLRKMFCQGFERGFHKGLKYAAPVQQIDLTDDEIEDAVGYSMTKAGLVDCRAVIAAYKEKNK